MKHSLTEVNRNTRAMAFLPFFLGLLVLGALVFIRRRNAAGLKDIPGPFWASFSTAWQIWRVFKGDIEWESIRLHKKHGHFVRISHKEVSVSHPDGIRAILLAPLRKADWYKVMALPDHRYQTPMSEVDPKRQVARAKNISSAFTMSNLLKSEKYMDDLIKLFHTRLEQFANSGEPVEFDKWFNYLAFDIVGEMTFSSSFGFVKSGRDIGGAIENTRVLTIYTALAGFFYTLHSLTLGNPLVTKLGLMPAQHIFDTTLRAINKRKENPEVRYDMIEHWKKTLIEHPERMQETEFYGVANMTIGAGADTISASLQALFYNLLRNPVHLKKVKAEVRNATTSEIITYSETQNLPFLQACVKEAQRMHPAVAFGLPRVAPDGGLKIGDKFFPAGTILSINPWVIHHSTEYFGKDAKEFNPERWLKPNSKELDKYYIPFGAGYNSCIGRNLALIELHKISAIILRDLEIRQVDPSQDWKYESHFTAVPYGWPCLVSRRDA